MSDKRSPFIGFKLARLNEQLGRIFHELRAGECGNDPGRGAIEDRKTDLRLQSGNASAERRLGNTR